MVQKWITLKDKNNARHIPLKSKSVDRQISNPHKKDNQKATPKSLEAQARGMLESLSKVTNVDQLLLGLKKYSGFIGEFSSYNSMLINFQDPDASIVRSSVDWKYFGRSVNPNAQRINILYPIGLPPKAPAGKIKDFIEKKRSEGIDDEEIEGLVHDKFKISRDTVHVFGTGAVYDIKNTTAIPGKGKPELTDIKATTLYGALKEIAKKTYTVEEGQINNARGYTAHTGNGLSITGTPGEGTVIKVMKIPGEDQEALHTLIHEVSHANLKHTSKQMEYGIAEGEAELSTYLVGQHYGFNFKDDSATYIKGWLDNSKGHKFGEENIDRCMNNARHIIQEIDGKLR